MADFVAVIKRAVDGLAENSPEMRARVYDKARGAVRRQLESMTPRPADAAIESQLAKLESAIEMVEVENAPPFDLDENLVFAELEEPAEAPPPPVAEEPAAEAEPVPPAAAEGDAAPEEIPGEIHEEAPLAEPQAGSEPIAEIVAEHEASEPSEPHAPAETTLSPEEEQAAAERTARVGATPVPFGSYAIGRAPSFPMQPREPLPMRTEIGADGFTPSRYQSGFGRLDRPAGTAPSEAAAEHVQPFGTEDIPAAEHVASTELTEEAGAPADAGKQEPQEEPRRPESTVTTAALPAAAPTDEHEIVSPAEDEEPQPEEAPVEPEAHQPAPAEPFAEESDPRWEPQDSREEDPNAELLLFEEELRRSEAELAQSHEPGGVSATRDETNTEPEEPAPPRLAPREQDDASSFDRRDQALAGATARAAQRQQQFDRRTDRRRGGGWKRIAVAAVLLLVLIGAGYAAWSNQDRIVALFSGGGETGGEVADTAEAPAEDVAAVAPEDAAPEEGDVQKFTQRLLPSGREVDEGAAELASNADAEDEGRSLALQSGPGEDAAGEEAGAEDAPAAGETLAEEDVAAAGADEAAGEEAIGVAETMFLYEERQGDEAPTALEGSVVWTLVEEPPIQGEEPEPAIRGDITVPDNDFTARVTIRRNADPSLPASHLIELVFSLPPEFGGGGIETVRRVAFKETEQDRGNELIAVPARITDDFFMVALNDYAEAVQTNLQLMGERDWIDIPIVYENDRRALITLNKGTVGTQVFDEALGAWQRMNGSAAPAPAADQQAPAGDEEAPAEGTSGG